MSNAGSHDKDVLAGNDTESSQMEVRIPGLWQQPTAILESITDGFISLDTDWRNMYVNRSAEKLLARNREELLNKTLWEAFHMSEPTRFFTQARQAMETQKSAEYTDFFPPLNKWFTVRFYPSPHGLVCLFQDVTPQKQIELQQQASEKRFQALLEHSTDAIALVDQQGRRLYATPSSTRITGYEPTENIGESTIANIHPDDRAYIVSKLHEILQTPGKTIHGQYRIQHKDGHWVWLESTATNLLNEPAVQAIVINYRDITERKHVEEQLQYYASMAQSISDVVISTNLQYTILSWNDAAEKLYGWKREEVIGNDATKIIPTQYPYHDEKQWLEHFQTHGYWKGEVIQQRKDGSRIHALSSLSPIKDHAGQTIGIVVVNRDITERKALEEEVIRAKEQLETILQNVADGISMQDASEAIVYINDVAARLSGFASAEEVYTAPLSRIREIISRFDIKDEAGNPFPYDQLPGRRVIRGEPYAQATMRYINKETGETHWSQVKAQAIFDKQGKVKFAVNVITDITERMELEQRKDEFISMASHELKTPVTSLKGYTQVLQRRLRKQGDEQTIHFLQRMDVQLNKLTALISDLLDISKMQTGKLTFREELFQLGSLVRETVENLQSTTHHHLTLHIETDPTVFGDRDRIGQVVINLLTNAIKYSAQANEIIITVKQHDKEAIVSVQDFGIGIAEEHQHKVFERFYQVTNPMEKTFPGLGIGLYISNQIIKRHQGRMWVESQVGEGSTFSFALPLSTQ